MVRNVKRCWCRHMMENVWPVVASEKLFRARKAKKETHTDRYTHTCMW